MKAPSPTHLPEASGRVPGRDRGGGEGASSCAQGRRGAQRCSTAPGGLGPEASGGDHPSCPGSLPQRPGVGSPGGAGWPGWRGSPPPRTASGWSDPEIRPASSTGSTSGWASRSAPPAGSGRCGCSRKRSSASPGSRQGRTMRRVDGPEIHPLEASEGGEVFSDRLGVLPHPGGVPLPQEEIAADRLPDSRWRKERWGLACRGCGAPGGTGVGGDPVPLRHRDPPLTAPAPGPASQGSGQGGRRRPVVRCRWVTRISTRRAPFQRTHEGPAWSSTSGPGSITAACRSPTMKVRVPSSVKGPVFPALITRRSIGPDPSALLGRHLLGQLVGHQLQRLLVGILEGVLGLGSRSSCPKIWEPARISTTISEMTSGLRRGVLHFADVRYVDVPGLGHGGATDALPHGVRACSVGEPGSCGARAPALPLLPGDPGPGRRPPSRRGPRRRT